jgi:hypothetical protein
MKHQFRNLFSSILLIAFVAPFAFANPGPEPSVGLYWVESFDPTAGAGVCAPQWQLLFRTDNNTLYYKSGVACAAWTPFAGSGGGTITGGGAANAITKWTAPTVIGNSASTDDGTTTTIGDALAVTGFSTFNGSALFTHNVGVSPGENVDESQAAAQIGAFSLGTATTTAVSGTLSDWVPTFTSGNGFVSILRINATGATTITGYGAATHDGRQIYFQNSGAATIAITNQDSSSAAANRFITPSGTNISMIVGAVMHMHYDITQARWIVEYVSTLSGGTGTANVLAAWNSGGGLGNSLAPVTDDGTTFNINGSLFAVTESTGHTAVSGGLASSNQNNGASIAQTNTATAQTSGSNDVSLSNAATYNTTATAIEQHVVNVNPDCSISSGANALTCVGINVSYNNSATNNYGITTQPASRVAIGMDGSNAPASPAMLEVRNDDQATGGDPTYNIRHERNNNSSSSGVKLDYWRLHGTYAAPTATTTGDGIAAFNFDGVNTGGTQQNGMQVIVSQDQGSAAAAAPMAFVVDVTGRSGNALTESFRIDSVGHIQLGQATTPTLSSCGSSPTIDGVGMTGTITEGTGATGCTLTFGEAWNLTTPNRVPHCVLHSEMGYIFQYTISNTAITITNIGPLSSTNIDYLCFAGGAS